MFVRVNKVVKAGIGSGSDDIWLYRHITAPEFLPIQKGHFLTFFSRHEEEDEEVEELIEEVYMQFSVAGYYGMTVFVSEDDEYRYRSKANNIPRATPEEMQEKVEYYKKFGWSVDG